MTKTFAIRTVLSVTTHRLLTKPKGNRDNGIGDLYEILNWMTNDNLFTHQLPRACQQCSRYLLRLMPELEVSESKLSEMDGNLKNSRPTEHERVIERWIESLGLKSEYEIPQIPMDDQVRIDPYSELVAMRGGTDGIVVIDQDGVHADHVPTEPKTA